MRIQTNPREKGHLQSNNFIFFHLLSHWQGIKPPPTGWFQFEFYQVPVKCLLLPLKDCSCCSSRHPCSDKNDAAKVGCCFWDGHKVPDGHSGAATASCHSFFPPHILLHFVTHSWHWQEFPKYQQSIDFSILSSAFPLSKGQCIPRELRQQLNPGQGQSALLPLLILPPLLSSVPFHAIPSCRIASQQCPCKGLFSLAWLLSTTDLQ